jgi:hypothetical protein
VGLGVAGVESSLEAQLEGDPGVGDGPGDLDRGRQVERQGFLAEGGQPAGGGAADQLRVSRGRHGDHHRVRAVERLVVRGDRDRVDLIGRVGCPVRQRIGDDEVVDPGRRREDPGVEPADPAGADEGDPHADARGPGAVAPGSDGPEIRRSAAASTRRPIAALSAGGSQPLSCSTMSQPS